LKTKTSSKHSGIVYIYDDNIMTKSQYETFSVLDMSFCNWIFLFWKLLCMSFYDCILFSPEKTSKYALKPEETVKKPFTVFIAII